LGRWLQGLGFVESGGFIGKEGSFPGYESITMYSPSRHTTIEVGSTKHGSYNDLPGAYGAAAPSRRSSAEHLVEPGEKGRQSRRMRPR
jgi:hypothetical protein